MANPNFTDITVLLDCSQSMGVVRAETISGFNGFVDAQRRTTGKADLTLVQFNHGYLPVYQGLPVIGVPLLSMETYAPTGNTALLDGIGRLINETGARLSRWPEAMRPGKVIFVIITDGEENSSKEFTRARVFEMIEHQRKHYAWEFVFLGANQDAIQAGGAIGVATANSMTFAHNAEGTQSAYQAMSENTVKYRVGATASMAFSPDQRDAQLKAGVQGGQHAS